MEAIFLIGRFFIELLIVFELLIILIVLFRISSAITITAASASASRCKFSSMYIAPSAMGNLEIEFGDEEE